MRVKSTANEDRYNVWLTDGELEGLGDSDVGVFDLRIGHVLEFRVDVDDRRLGVRSGALRGDRAEGAHVYPPPAPGSVSTTRRTSHQVAV